MILTLLSAVGLLFALLFMPFTALFKVFGMNEQQAKRLAILFVRLGMMCSVRPQYPSGIRAIQLPEPTKTLVDVHIVDQKINQAIYGNADANKQ